MPQFIDRSPWNDQGSDRGRDQVTIRNLDFVFHPASVALVGASHKQGSIGTLIARNLLEGGFEGDLFFVNPKYKKIEGCKVYPDVGSLPKAPDLAVIA
ncbi:MAG: CoA-binding protein, partial [Bacteroidota bacterium]